MPALKNVATVAPGFSNQIEWTRVTYDFAQDTGAIAAYDIFVASAPILVVAAWASVKTACTSAGSATVNWGPTADDDRFMTVGQGAVANLTLGAVIVPVAVEGTPNVLATPYLIAANGVILMDITTAALTAGSIEFCIGYMQP